MQHLMRRYKTYIFVFIILFIGVPMLFWSVPTLRRPGQIGAGLHETEIAKVGDISISAAEYKQRLDQMAQLRRNTAADQNIYRALDEDGTAQRILQQLIDQALLKAIEKQRNLHVNREYLEKQMQKWDLFKNEKGEFDVEAWNHWVTQNRTADWNKIYQDVRDSVSRDVHLAVLKAHGVRVLEQDIEKALIDDHTHIVVKYVKIDPPVELTEEQLRSHYEENKEKYRRPDAYVAQAVAISLVPPVPEKAKEILDKARSGADFAALADEYSELKAQQGGDLGWQKQRTDNLPEYLQAMYMLKPGEVSEPVYSGAGYFIYKVEEERIAEDGAREVHVRQIFLRAQLSDDERKAKEELADKVATKARETKDLSAAAAEFGLTVFQTNPFTTESETIDGVPSSDVRAFRAAFAKPDTSPDYTVIKGRWNLYVPAVVSKTPGEIPAFEEVRDKVKQDALAAAKKTDDYKKRVEEYAEKIKQQAKHLEDIPRLFPELNAEIKTTREFTRKDYLFQDQVYLQTPQVYDAVGRGEPGTMGGPLKDFRGDTYFVELVSRRPPTDEEKAKFDEERQELMKSSLMTAQNDRIQDYIQDLRERALKQIPVKINEDILAQLLGRNEKSGGGQAS